MSGEILFLAHRLPFPPDRGDKIRSHHVLKGLAALAPVHVATFADSAGDWAHEGALAALAASHCLVPRSKSLPRAGAEAVLAGRPVSLAAFHDAALAAYVRQVLAERPISAIYAFSGQMGQYVPADWGGRLVVDLVDVDSAKFGAYAQGARFPLGLMYRREERLLRAEEQRLACRAKATLLVSEEEAALLRSRLADPAAARVRALGNGIDAAFFDPDPVVAQPELAGQGAPQLLFTGQMDYPPNIAAVQRMAQRIMPQIRAVHPGAAFHVVGRAPTAAVLALEGVNGCRVWGAVPDMRPFLAGADLVTVPLEIARGVQNKVLEAMAMARPVLLSPGAATGIAARDGEHFLIAENDKAFARQALALLADPARCMAMGKAGRNFVLDHQSWPAMLAPLAQIMGFDHASKGTVRHAA